MSPSVRQTLLIVVLSGLFATGQSHAELRVAAAANFAPVLPALAQAFTESTGIALQFSTASTGSLYAQIHHGAPFALLLSADQHTAAAIADSEHGVASSLQTITCGELVLWSAKQAITDGEAWLHTQPKAKIALANPKTAPYGAAAEQLLNQLSWQGVRVQAENIAQAYQFGASGNVDAAFIAHSHYIAGQLQGGWRVPAARHAPLIHSAVITRNVSIQQQQQAQQFLDFLQSDRGQKIFQHAGYRRCDTR